MRKYRWISKVIVAVCLLGIAGLIFYLATMNTRKLLYKELTKEEIVQWSLDAYEEAIVQTDEMIGLDKMKVIASNGGSKLYFHEETCELAVQTADGTVWYTNPQNRLGFNTTAQTNFASQILINIITSEEVAKTLYSYTDAVQYGQFVTEKIENGIRIEYRFGRLKKIRTYPEGMTEERFNEVMATLSKTEQAKMQQYYSRVDVSTTDPTQLKTMYERFLNLDEIGVLYVLKSNPSPLIQKNLLKYFGAIGYTMEQRDADHEAIGYVDDLNATQNAMIPVEYTLEDGIFRAKVLTEDIEAVDGVKIQSIQVLPYMNNGDIDSASLLVPDGQGSVMRFGDIVSTNTSVYEETVYGVDNSVYKTGSTSNRQTLYFPFYGMMTDSGSVLAVIEQGDAAASLRITPRIGEMDYGTVSFKFKVLDFANIKLMQEDEETVRSYADKANLDTIEVSYRFMSAEQSEWMDVANAYRTLLKSQGKLQTVQADMAPAVLNLIGAIDDVEPFLGFPREVIVPLTSYEQAGLIAQEMREALQNAQLVLRYTGWQDGGIKSPVMNDLSLESALGDEEAMLALMQLCAEKGIDLFPDVDFQYVYRTSLFDGYDETRDAARFVISETAHRATYNMANFMADPNRLFGIVLNADSMLGFAKEYIPQAKEFGLGGLSLTYFGKEVNSDFERDHFVTRNTAQKRMEEIMQFLTDSGMEMLTTGANLYAAPYAEYMVGISAQSNAHPLVKESVPLTQILLSGSVAYTADPLGNAADKDYYMLKCIETGSGVYADLIWEDNSLLKGTKYDGYYSVNYATMKSEVIRVANEVAKALKPVYGSAIVNYEKLAEGFVRVSYENGGAILVNYNTEAMTADTGETVQPMSYANTTWR